MTMGDERSPDDPLLMSGTLPDETLERLLDRVARRQRPDPAFAERLRRRLRAPAPLASGSASTVRPGVARAIRPGRRRLLSASVAFAAGAALLFALAPRRTALPPLPPVARTLAADTPALLRAPAGGRVAVAFGSEQRPLARLELRDGAEVTYRPHPPRLELAHGFVRVVNATPLRLRAADEEVLVQPGSDAAFELVRNIEGGQDMRSLWLIPASAVSGAAVTLAILVSQGRVALSQGPAATGEVVVLHPPDRTPPPQRHLADLEKKVSTLQQENGRLAGQLARRKGVTPASVLERIATLKSAPLAGMLSPAALAELVTDLKGLGEEGIKTMIDLLKSGDEKERFLAANILEQLNAPAAIPALRQAALTDTDKMASVMAGHALALMDDAGTVPALREIADANKTWESRVNALWGLCKHGDQHALTQALAFMKDDKHSDQARAALGANLMLLTDPELMPVIDETMKRYGTIEQIGTLAVNYYKSAGTPEARGRLEAMAGDGKLPEAVRKAAREALAGKR
jgi:HEAT repeat protein